MKTLKTPNRLELSVANIDASARHVTWFNYDDGEAHEPGDGVRLNAERDYDLVIPAPTYDDLRQYTPHDDERLQKACDSKTPGARQLPQSVVERFEQTSAYEEWRDTFDPMMNYVWPVNLAYQVNAETAAELIAEFAPTCTLVSFNDDGLIGEDHGIALSGGGMNLADQLAIAYLCCGCVPPAGLLGQLPGVIDRYTLRQVGTALRKAYRAAAEFHRQRAKRAKEDAKRLFAKPRAAL